MYRLREHTADVAVEARGETLGAAMAAVADGTAAAACESVPDGGAPMGVVVRAERPEALLFDYLDELIYRRDVDRRLPVDNDAVVRAPDGSRVGAVDPADWDPDGVVASADATGDGDRDESRGSGSGDDGGAVTGREGGDWLLAGSARGVPLEAISARDVKAATYSEMQLDPGPDGWEAYVVLDV